MSARCVNRMLSTKHFIRAKMGAVTIHQGGYKCKCRAGTRSDGTNSGCRPVLRQAEKVVVGKGHTREKALKSIHDLFLGFEGIQSHRIIIVQASVLLQL
jgi:hypothetical protein